MYNSMSTPEAIVEAIKQRRETRDRIMLQNLRPVLEQLQTMVNTWVDDEFKDLEDEIEQVDDSTPRESAAQRIERFRTEIRQIHGEQLPQAMKELDSLIEQINQQSFKCVEDAIGTLEKKVSPILSVMWNLLNARERLDGMADMIPVPEPFEIIEEDEDNPDNRE
jgi:hypothetical protein